MAPRRRDRRLPPATTTTAASPTLRPPPPSRSKSLLPLISLSLPPILLILFLLYPRHPNPNQPQTLLSVSERGLVNENPTFQDILAEHDRVSANRTVRRFPNPVLAYVTPWNSLGYEMAEKFSSKLTHVSPVWYELKSEGKKLVMEGRHNADLGWISKVRTSGHSKVLPRVVLEVFPSEFLTKKQLRNKMVNIIVNECKEMGYDGVVLESWSRWAAYGVLSDTAMRNKGIEFIKQLGQALHSVNTETNPDFKMELVYVIPAPHSQDLTKYDFGPDDFQHLRGVVDGFSLMTYDFSGPSSPGPNAPLIWIQSCLKKLIGDDVGSGESAAIKIFLGVNFYGNDFILSEGLGGGAITGRDYISLLEKHKPSLKWEEKSAEHFFIYSHNNVKHAVFYPSLMSISKRLDEAQAWGVSLSIWEIGQGLQYFYDLL